MQPGRADRRAGRTSARVAIGLLALGVSGAAAAQVPHGNWVELPAQQARSGVELDIELHALTTARSISRQTTRSLGGADLPALRIGEPVEICFRSTQSGYVTLWSRTAGDPPVRIYPNAYSHAGADAPAERVPPGERICVGSDERFRLRVVGPPGVVSSLYLHWTPREAEQLPADAFPVIGRGASVPEARARHASTTLEFRVIE